MFSAEYLTDLASKTGFQTSSLQKQMSLIVILREIQRHPVLKNAFALRGGTAINLFWYNLPRLSVDIDLNYVGSPHKDVMQRDRGPLETQLSRLLESLGVSVERRPDTHAGGKWRLRTASVFGGNITLAIDINYTMRIPVWGIQSRAAQSPDADYTTTFPTVSLEELFAGKLKALIERSAARDLYDVYRFMEDQSRFDLKKLRKAFLLFGVTSEKDWRELDYSSIDAVSPVRVEQELRPLLRSSDRSEVETMKIAAKRLFDTLMKYSDDEQSFLEQFLGNGVYDPRLLFENAEHSEALKEHPAVLWKLQNYRRFLGLEGR